MPSFVPVLVTYPIDIAFAISATSTEANELYDYMMDAIKYIIDKYGMYYVHYAFMVFGSEPDVQITFGESFNSPDKLKGLLDIIVRLGGQPNLEKALEKAAELFEPGYEGERPGVRKFLVVIVDRDTVGDENLVRRHAKDLENSGVKVRLIFSSIQQHKLAPAKQTELVVKQHNNQQLFNEEDMDCGGYLPKLRRGGVNIDHYSLNLHLRVYTKPLDSQLQ